MNILEKLKKAVEICRPDLRHYYKMVRKARVVNTYASSGKYYCDVQPLKNDESPDEKEPVIPRVALPVFWGGNNRGIVCPPEPGVLCDLSYYDGDPNYPFISNIRYDGKNPAPRAERHELVIQLEEGTKISIDREKNIIALSPASYKVTVQGNAEITAQNAVICTAKTVSVNAASSVTVNAPQINQNGNVSSGGAGGGKGSIEENADRTQHGNFILNGNITVKGTLTADNCHINGNAFAATRSGGTV